MPTSSMVLHDGRRAREQLVLHLARNFNFRLQAFFLSRDHDEVFDLLGHVVEGTAEIGELIVALDRNPPGKIALRDL